jgi:uncharacterized protein (UPF0261 family)
MMTDRATVVLLGTLDTKGLEYDFLRQRIRAAGCDVILIDAGSGGEPAVEADVDRETVARAAGADVAELARLGDRGLAVATMARGATAIVHDLHARGRLHGMLGLGGSGGSALVTQAMRALPIGVPKLMVSTMASGDTRPYVGTADIAMMYSVVDIAGINRVSARILTNAAAAITGMARAYAAASDAEPGKPVVAATMFGVTTPCVTVARQRLEELGYEVLVFHAVGTGGQAMEALVDAGFIAGVLDATTTELADELVGGVLSAGPHRLEAAGARGVPQVVSLGALDMVNFGPPETVPDRFRGRRLYQHNPTVTLMRTTPAECAELGHIIGRKLNAATGPVAVFVPLRGVSAIAVKGGAFYDAEADRALLAGLRAELREDIEVRELDLDINDVRFAQAMAERLDQLIRARTAGVARGESRGTNTRSERTGR